MSFQKFKTNSYCVGQKHYSGTKNIIGKITLNKKTGREIKLLVGQCSICNRKKSMIVSDNTIQAEGLGSFFKNLGRISARAGRKLATNVIKNPGRALEIIQILLRQLQLKTRKHLYHHYLKLLIFITWAKGCT